MNEFLQRLKERKLVQWTVAYVAAAFALLQGIDIIAQRFGWPEQTMRFVIIALSVGLFVTLVLAWYHGERGAQRVTGTELLILALLLVLGGGFLWRFTGASRKPAPITSSVPNASQSLANAKSIAVLPFLNESGDPKDEYFSDGLSEELISALAQIGDLKVIGRSSSFRFKGKNEESKTIGEKLGVSTLLEGTVRKQADRVRIVAELINAADGSEVWSQTFDRALKDVFAVQSEIASAVASSLKLTLLGDGKTGTNIATTNAEAHNAYLEGYFYLQRRSTENCRRAIRFFEEAIQLDPDYALAHAKSAEAWTWIADQSGDPHHEGWANARREAEKAVAIDPNLAEAHAALGWVLAFSEWKSQEGVAELRRAIELAPGSATANGVLSSIIASIGRIEEAEKFGRRAVEIDPLDYNARNNLARVLYYEGKLDEAIAQGRKSAELQPTADSSRRWQALAAVLKGDSQLALREAALEPNEGYRLFCTAVARFSAGDHVGSDAALADLIAKDHSFAAYQIAQTYAWRNEKEKAFAWLQTALEGHDTGLLSLLMDPLMKNLRGDPRYSELLAKVGLPKST